MFNKLGLSLFLLSLYTGAVVAEFSPNRWYSAVVDANGNFYVTEGREGIASARLTAGMETSGWDTMEVSSSKKYNNTMQAYAAGYVEAAISTHKIYDAFRNFANSTSNTLSSNVKTFIEDNMNWLRQNVQSPPAGEENYWTQVGLVMSQFDGMFNAYQQYAPADQSLTLMDFLAYELQWELGDIQTSLGESNEYPMDLHCSVLIKPTSDGLFQSHDTWSTYTSMLRMYKHYDLEYQGAGTQSVGISFSSFPAAIPSGDDFYITSNGLVIMETTNGVFNKTLFQHVTTETVPYWIRVVVANRMATGGKDWSQTFAKYNSGTYNNQWMVINNNQVTKGASSFPANTLWILEQIPGYVVMDDQTSVLNLQGYWPSYNIPFYPFIYNMSGYAKCVQTNPSECSYHFCARAQIFRRDQHKVTDLKSMKAIMRYNEYQTDDLSLHDACRGISARCDLNTPWVNKSLNGWAAFGGIDNKIASSSWIKQRGAEVVAGPTWDSQPPFAWTQEWRLVPHYGMPKVMAFDYIFTKHDGY